ncbi:WD40 repeat protein [Flavobacteriaceae bacterium MAR_2009_75]|nr:WD40 repeat protein [Flavobacteriaceae bacterium MAR_2009_75]
MYICIFESSQKKSTIVKNPLILFLSILIILGLFSCKFLSKPTNYLNQTVPDSHPVVFAPDIVSAKGRLEHGISFSPDGQEMTFGILNNDDSGQIFYSKMMNEDWTEPMIFEPLKGKSVFLPYFSPDGKSLLYAQSKPEVNYLTDIGKLEKSADGWGSPQLIQHPLSSKSREANASMTYNGTIYFSSNRNCEGKENCFTADLFYSALVDEEYRKVEVISELLSPNDEESVFISPNEDYLIFCRYTSDETATDLYITYRDINKKWTVPRVLDSAINSNDWDRRPFVSIDNKFLFFTRLQVEQTELRESDIFWANTSKVFKPFVFNPVSNTTIKVGEKFEILLPADYFKDIDDQQLTLSLNTTEYDWLEFDNKNNLISGLPTETGNFELTFTAVDKFLNTTENQVKLKVTD